VVPIPGAKNAQQATDNAGALGNVRTQTLRAFTAADIKNILGKVV
jgi:uncharacterized protein with GYD domain